MKEVTQSPSTITTTVTSLPKAMGWALGHFGLIVLICLLATWNFFLSHFTMEGFTQNVQDFGRFYYATLAYLNGQDMYGPTQGTLIQITPLYAHHLWELNPPHFHLLIFPLTYLSVSGALVTWLCIGIIALLVSGFLILKELQLSLSYVQWCLCICAILGFSGISCFLLRAQVSLLLTLPLTLAWISARQGHWGKSGIYLGLLAGAKLFFMIFIPYLLLRRQFRASGALLISGFAFFGIGIVVFGWQTYLEWARVLTEVNWAWGHTNASLFGFLSRTFSENPLYEPWDTMTNIYRVWFPFVCVIGSITIVAATLDTTPHSIDRAFMVLLLGACIISPLSWLYYLILPIGPFVALMCSWKKEWLKNAKAPRSSLTYLRNSLFLLGAPVLFLPVFLGSLFQPNPVATLLLASAYFWALLALWSSLVLDGVIPLKPINQESSSGDPQHQRLNLQPVRDAQLVNENRMY